MDASRLLAAVVYTAIAHTLESDGRVTDGWPPSVVAWSTAEFADDMGHPERGLTELENRLWCLSVGIDPEQWASW